jgi:hypothetical protein
MSDLTSDDVVRTVHSEGPWALEVEFSDEGGTDYAALSADGSCVAHLVAGNEQEHANARLIAAAPDLLDFAPGVERLFADAEKRGLHLDEDKQFIRDKARAAIAKAAP